MADGSPKLRYSAVASDSDQKAFSHLLARDSYVLCKCVHLESIGQENKIAPLAFVCFFLG
jgi:hypothetical protein